MTADYVDPRFPGPDPYAALDSIPNSITVTSTDFERGGQFAQAQLGGNDVSPQLTITNLPEGTKSLAITCFDPDAPTAAGFWHWAVCNIPADMTEIPTGHGDATFGNTPGALVLHGDGGKQGYYGPQPPAGHGPHRYLFAVHALDTEKLDLDENTTPTVLGFNLYFHSIARGITWGWHENHAE
ncbi:YbhB/YbcL family Raf kinase inhibitor-like protein [Corynebacterium choanae]|uniref:Putative kinase inhibitor protein n=1 Tax=Corynebacterium choanae TaxID=1862358 RepID=A0A3G6J738_9CORY|nr:YbhB/YbcL family Raf kinase inhibitor-like protein [Corynebacterium choanae]AZA13583.1 putative kinase inhibitor protein [Corynebacterium choanae]